MKKENTMMLIGTIIVVAILLCGSFAIKSASGVKPPFTVIESQSMQHSDESEIGIIDTADMILVKSPAKTRIVTYVEGYSEKYSTFGDFGSVIVYKRAIGNPVIHRAIIELSYNNVTNKWEAPSLANYEKDGVPLWNCTASSNYLELSGTLKIQFEDNYRRTHEISIHLDSLNHTTGYITMGDNNGDIDQNSSISNNKLIEKETIKSVAWKEIPWIGAIKLISKGEINKVQTLVPNTIPNLIAFFFTIILSVVSIGFVIDEISLIKIRKKYEE